MTLARKAVLVDLNISSWSGRKLDRKVSQETTQAKGAARDAARVNKNLFAGSDRLERINNFVSLARQEYYSMTLPWSTSGTRLLPFMQFFEFKDWVSQKEQEFTGLVNTFLREYSTLISAQAFRLGTMFDAKEYPSAAELALKFRFSHTIMPLPETGDFRVDAENEFRTELEEQYAKAYAERTSVAMNDLWTRLYDTTKHMSEKCGLEKTQFRESTLTNALSLCDLLKKLNVTNDAQLEARRLELERALLGLGIDDLRKDASARKETKTKMDEILGKMAGVGIC